MALARDRYYRVLRTVMPYHYKESGLDNVLLQRGYTIRQTPYGETVAIHDVDAVHRAIAAKLVTQPHLTGAELRFLRLEMDQTQAELAETLGTSEQTVSLWERHRKKPIPETAAKLLQVIVDARLMLKRNVIKRAISKAYKAAGKLINLSAKLRNLAIIEPDLKRVRITGVIRQAEVMGEAKRTKKRAPVEAKKRRSSPSDER
jgi:DNA-binding transcriptional regulator YiaG